VLQSAGRSAALTLPCCANHPSILSDARPSPFGVVNPRAIAAMHERGYDIEQRVLVRLKTLDVTRAAAAAV
jgi:hypothetical protein